MSDNTVILEVNDLHKSYGDHEVLKGISTFDGYISRSCSSGGFVYQGNSFL